MKMKLVMIALALTAATILVAGCTSFGGNSTPSPTTATAAPAAGQNTATPSQGASFTFTQSLTDAQKTQARTIAQNNATVKDILNKAGYSITSVNPAGTQYATEGMNVSTVLAVVSIEGGNAQHADGSLWTTDQYSVFVDVNRNLVTSITHIEPKPLPTAPSLAPQ